MLNLVVGEWVKAHSELAEGFENLTVTGVLLQIALLLIKF